MVAGMPSSKMPNQAVITSTWSPIANPATAPIRPTASAPTVAHRAGNDKLLSQGTNPCGTGGVFGACVIGYTDSPFGGVFHDNTWASLIARPRSGHTAQEEQDANSAEWGSRPRVFP